MDKEKIEEMRKKLKRSYYEEDELTAVRFVIEQILDYLEENTLVEK